MSGGAQPKVFDWGVAALSLGADRVLVKPFDQQQFLSIIQDMLACQADTTEAMSSSGLADLRKHARLPVHLPASFGDGTIEKLGIVLDISLEGCRLRCPDAKPLAQYFQMQIRLIEPQDTLKVDLAVKRWSRNGDLGVEFIRLEPTQQGLLRWMIWNCHAVSPSPPEGSCLPI